MKKYIVEIKGVISVEEDEDFEKVWLKIAKHFLDLSVETVDAESQFSECEIKIEPVKKENEM